MQVKRDEERPWGSYSAHGEYFGEDDIVRLDDDFGRAT
jgi:hypothetical protein